MTPAGLPEGFGVLEPVVQMCTRLRVPWWLAGGWAIDLWAGYVSRPHNGIDLFMMGSDVEALTAQLGDAVVSVCDAEGRQVPVEVDRLVANERLRLFVDAPGLALSTQVAFGGRDGDDWVSERDSAIRCRLDELGGERHGVPCLAPRLVLFFRAFSFRDQDQADFATALPLLGPGDRQWLRSAIARLGPVEALGRPGVAHPWSAALER
jgi:hypothetical protein